MFRAVGKRCAVNLQELDLPIPTHLAIEILENRGFKIFNYDVVSAAQKLIKQSVYKLGAKQHEAPHIFDCSSFTKWLYGHCGIWLPRRTIQQIDCGVAVSLEDIQAGDLIFKTGRRGGWYRTDPTKNVGHVGIATGNGSVIHASNTKLGVVEGNLKCFTDPKKFRGVQRIIPDPKNTLFFHLPCGQEVESSDDFFWIIVQTLGSKT